jgi:hypothetical protein
MWKIADISNDRTARIFSVEEEGKLELVSCLASSSTLQHGGDAFDRNLGTLLLSCPVLQPRKRALNSHGREEYTHH